MTHKPAGQVCSCGERGWMPGVEHAPIRWGMAPYNQRTDMQPVAIVDHIMQGYLNTMVQWTTTGASKVIVHFGIGRDGRIVQMHPVFSPGIHAGAFDHRSPHAAKVVKARSTSPNAYTIGIEHEGCSVDPRPAYSVPAAMIYSRANPWPEAMVEASIRVHRWLFANVPSLGTPSRDSVIGHYETGDPNRVNDPAAASDRGVWPVSRILAALTPSKEPAKPKEATVALTPDQQYIVDQIRATPDLTEAQVRDALATVGLVAMPGEEQPQAPAQPKPPTTDKGAEVEELVDEIAEDFLRLSAKLQRLRVKAAAL